MRAYLTTEVIRVIVVTHNSEKDIRECLTSLQLQTSTCKEIVVVDNASTDNTVQIVSQEFPEVRLVKNPVNSGYTGGCNLGVGSSPPQYVAFVNPDTLGCLNWLQTAISELEANQDAGACQPKILLYGDRMLLNSRGNQANFLFFAWPEGYGEKDDAEDPMRKIPYASGAAAIYKTECLKKSGLFDELYFMYHDDFDLGMRSFLVGYNTIYCPRSEIYHKYWFKESARRYFLLERNRLLTLLKIYRLRTLCAVAPAFVMAEVGVLTRALVDGWFIEKIATYGSVLGNLRHVLKFRALTQKSRVSSDVDLIRILRGGIYFSSFERFKAVAWGNRLLEKYKDFLLNLHL
jgi:GT2 family glycosyltransferase